MYSFINYKCVNSLNTNYDIIHIIHNLLDNLVKYAINNKKNDLTKSILIKSNPKFFKLLKNIEDYINNNNQKGGKGHHHHHQKPPDFYCGDVKPYSGFCDNHYSQCCSTSSCNTALGGKRSKKKSLTGGKGHHHHQKPPDFYCGDVKPYSGFCDNHYSQCCSTSSCNTTLGGKRSKKKSLTGGKGHHHHQKPPDFYCGDVKPYSGFCDNHYSQCCSTSSCNTTLGGKRSKKKSLTGGKGHHHHHQKPPDFYCGDVKPYSGFCDNHYSQCCSTSSCNTTLGGKRSKKKSLTGGKGHHHHHQKPPDFYCGDVKPYSGFCDNHYSQCCSTSSCNTTLGGKRSKRKAMMEGGNLICGDVQAYPGFCDSHTSQCCTLQNSSSCTKTGGRKKRNKFQKGGGDIQCGDVTIYSGFCDNASSQCCGNIGGNSGACAVQSGGKKKQRGSSYDGMLAQLNSSKAYTPSIYEIERFNKKVADGLDIPCIEGGINMNGGGGAQIQLSAGSPTPITPEGLFDYTYNIMDKMSSHDPPLEWATHFSNGDEAAGIIELNNDIYAHKIQKGLPTNYQLGGKPKCKLIDNKKFKIYVLKYLHQKHKKLTITDKCIQILSNIILMWYILVDKENNLI